MNMDGELSLYGKRLAYYAFFVNHFVKVDEIQRRHQDRAIWTAPRFARLKRVMFLLEGNCRAISSLREERNIFQHDMRLERMHDQVLGLAETLGNLVLRFDNVMGAMLERQGSTTH